MSQENNIQLQLMQGNFAAWPDENSGQEIKNIVGNIPVELNGRLLRNGPNPQFPLAEKHWFEGDGMLHAMTIRDGKCMYQNRFIATERYQLEKQAGKPLFGGFGKFLVDDPKLAKTVRGTANTNIIQHGGRLLALNEASLPVEINMVDLSTIGRFDYQGQIPSLTAHPHFDYHTGEMHAYSYSLASSDVIYYVMNAKGVITKTEKINAPFSSFMHDFFITSHDAIFPVMPLTSDINRPQQGKPVVMWEPERGAHIGIMPRNGTHQDIIWFNLPAFYAYHFMNAYRENHSVILDGMKANTSHLFPDANGKMVPVQEDPPLLTRWIFNLKNKSVKEIQLDNKSAEFPRFDERYTGRPYQHGFVAATLLEPDSFWFDALIHYDLKNNKQTVRHFSSANAPSEPVFVPRNKDANEGDGFLLTVVYNSERDASDLYILDAMHIDQEPYAIVPLPNRVPYGFHGNWMEFE